MARKNSTNSQPIQTPGVETPKADAPAQADTGAPLAPDIQALVAAEVAKALNKAKPSAKGQRAPLPSHDEALAQVKADPKHRSVLSTEGWVVYSAPVKERDESGFAKA